MDGVSAFPFRAFIADRCHDTDKLVTVSGVRGVKDSFVFRLPPLGASASGKLADAVNEFPAKPLLGVCAGHGVSFVTDPVFDVFRSGLPGVPINFWSTYASSVTGSVSSTGWTQAVFRSALQVLWKDS